MDNERLPRKLAAVLYADVAGYSRLTGEDEEGTHRLLRAYLDYLSACVTEHGGRVVHYAGDALLADFATATDAVRCACAGQSELADRNATLPAERKVRFRMGVNLGEVIEDRGEIYGDGVNVAARLESLAEPGGICVSGAVCTAVGAKLPIEFEDLGERTVKNIANPLRIYGVRSTSGFGLSESGTESAPLAEGGDTSSASTHPTIAVMPFLCLSDERMHDYLADGLAEDLTTLLACIPGFLVIARGSAFVYKGKRVDTRQIAAELGVRYVVEGSLRPVGQSVRVNTQLIDARAGAQLWAERFDRPEDHVLELQDEITQAMVARIEPALAQAELARLERQPPGNLDAWDLYRRAHGLLALKGWAPSTFREGIELLRQAVALEPSFALAHAYLSLLLALGHMFHVAGSGDDLGGQADAEAERAVDLDGRDSTVLGYAGCALCDIGQSRRGLLLLKRAVEANPSNAQAWTAYGVGLIRSRKPREGVEKLRHGIRISPMDTRLAYWETILANALLRLRELEAALAAARSACQRDARFANARVVLAMVLVRLDRAAEAEDVMSEARRLAPDLSADQLVGLIGRRGVSALEQAGLAP